jgi:hypothetical protein
LQSVLEARAFDNIYRHFDELSEHFMQPDPWSILANLIYWTMLLLIAGAKAVSLAVIAFGLIASAVCGLLGPIFVPFFIVPKLDWLFWGWLRSFIQYSFVPVVAIAFLMVFEQFVFRYVTTLPPMITQAEYGVYACRRSRSSSPSALASCSCRRSRSPSSPVRAVRACSHARSTWGGSSAVRRLSWLASGLQLRRHDEESVSARSVASRDPRVVSRCRRARAPDRRGWMGWTFVPAAVRQGETVRPPQPG